MKSFLTKSFLIYFLFSAFNVFAGDPPVASLGAIINPNGGSEDEFCLDLQNNLTVTLQVAVTNLHLFLPEATADGIERLPSGYHNMYLKYSINGLPYEIVPITEFTLIEGDYDVPTYISTFESYQVNLNAECVAAGGDLVSVTVRSELLTAEYSSIEEDFDYFPYPVCLYWADNDIFEVGLAAPECPEWILRNGIYILAADCDCSYPVQNELGFINNNEGEYLESKKSTQLVDAPNTLVSPNPFNEEFRIQISAFEDIKRISLFDINGKLIKEWSQDQIKGKSIINFNTTQISNGLYFLKINSEFSPEVIKLIKQ